jgi:prepilin-type N-terminal cleavage/methylation domain-containing protein
MPPPRRRHPGTRTSRFLAFTLIELMLVLLVLAILVAVAVPAFEGMARGMAGRDTATQLLALTYHARSQAVAEGVNYRLVLDVPNRSYYLAKQDGTEYVPLAEEVGRPHLFPEGVDVAYDDAFPLQQLQQSNATGQILPERPPSNLPFVEFYPSGRIDPAVIVVTSQRDGAVRKLICPSATETFRIVDQDGQPTR